VSWSKVFLKKHDEYQFINFMNIFILAAFLFVVHTISGLVLTLIFGQYDVSSYGVAWFLIWYGPVFVINTLVIYLRYSSFSQFRAIQVILAVLLSLMAIVGAGWLIVGEVVNATSWPIDLIVVSISVVSGVYAGEEVLKKN